MLVTLNELHISSESAKYAFIVTLRFQNAPTLFSLVVMEPNVLISKE